MVKWLGGSSIQRVNITTTLGCLACRQRRLVRGGELRRGQAFARNDCGFGLVCRGRHRGTFNGLRIDSLLERSGNVGIVDLWDNARRAMVQGRQWTGLVCFCLFNYFVIRSCCSQRGTPKPTVRNQDLADLFAARRRRNWVKNTIIKYNNWSIKSISCITWQNKLNNWKLAVTIKKKIKKF